ncbi:MAG: class I SAM-dependent methyltransferase [Candidatus Omnitrophica bacterium]|nr:class I SAM-dependent methyltransferase [Candidatus Omnitrophota bacterium]
MPREDWVLNSVQKIFEREGMYPAEKIKTVLDVGCGLSLKSQYIEAEVRVGVDIYRPFLERIETDVSYAVVNADIRDLPSLFLPKSFDLVLLLDIVEHLEKEDALKLLKAAEGIAKVAVIVETPKGYVPQNIDIWGCGGDVYQTHKSEWSPEEFLKRGYQVLLRQYRMSEIKRHTELEVDPNITMIDAILRMGDFSAREGQ